MKNFLRPCRKIQLTAGAICSCIALVFSATPSQGQTADPQQVDRARLLQSEPTGAQSATPATGVQSSGFAPAGPNDPDLGEQQILKRQDRYEAFNASVGAPFYYTSNVALVRRGTRDDVLIAPQIGLSYQPIITRTLYAEASVRQQFFYYNRFGQLDFASFDAGAGLIYYLPRLDNLALRARYNYNRLTSARSDFDEFFVNHSLFLSAELPIRFGRAQLLSLGAEADLSLYAHPSAPERNEYDLYSGYSINLSRSLIASASARLAFRDYHFGDRKDISEIIGLSLTCRPAKWCSLSAITSFAANQSNRSVFNYNVFNIGGGVGLSISF